MSDDISIAEIITTGRMRASYETGRISGEHRAEKQARIAAFGAIRRAAHIARIYDALALHDFEGVTKQEQIGRAYIARQVIRAAIGSEKES